MNTAPFKLELGADYVAVAFVRNPNARRYILRFNGGLARVTIPRGGTLQYAQEFARKNATWIEQQVRKSPPCWQDGTIILFRGMPTTLRVAEIKGKLQVSFAGIDLTLNPAADLRSAIEAHLRQLATEELPLQAAQIARELSLEVRKISVRNQRSRWGSCSLGKRISLNWRLIQTPECVRDYIIIHELMHLKEMNHSPRFWAHVEAACPAYREAEQWLRKNSRLLR